MTDALPALPARIDPDRAARRLKARYAAERRFRVLGFAAIALSGAALLFLLGSILASGLAGFQRTELRVPLDFAAAGLPVDRARLGTAGAAQHLDESGLARLVDRAAIAALGPDAARELDPEAWREVARAIIADPAKLDRKVEFGLPASDALAAALRGEGKPRLRPLARRLAAQGRLVRAWDPGFLARADSTQAQSVGIWGALKGSLMTMAITLALAFPVGVFAAIHLEEYAPRNRWTDLVEVSINNLAAVPSIIFGLLGLALFLGLFPNWRSAPLIGGMTLALMTMPVIVISARNAIGAVPQSVRDAALAIGASRVQVVFHHVLPLALPGIMTGTIIGMARALGETAPLLMIGMRAFVATPPAGATAPATVLPVQIFLWSDEIDRGFVERTSAAIIVLLLFLLAMNGLAIALRNRFEKRL